MQISRQEHKVLGSRLRHEHVIERIPAQFVKRSDCFGVLQGKGQTGSAPLFSTASRGGTIDAQAPPRAS